MTDQPDRPNETAQFETDTVRADRAREQGLGVGALDHVDRHVVGAGGAGERQQHQQGERHQERAGRARKRWALITVGGRRR